MIEFIVVVAVIVTVVVLGAMAVVMVGNWRYHRMKRDQRMSDAWLAKHR